MLIRSWGSQNTGQGPQLGLIPWLGKVQWWYAPTLLMICPLFSFKGVFLSLLSSLHQQPKILSPFKFVKTFHNNRYIHDKIKFPKCWTWLIFGYGHRKTQNCDHFIYFPFLHNMTVFKMVWPKKRTLKICLSLILKLLSSHLTWFLFIVSAVDIKKVFIKKSTSDL